MNEEVFPSYEKLTSLVLKYFPTSKWKRTHYAWYKSKIKRGEIPIPGIDPDIPIINPDGTDDDVQESIEASLSLERDLHSYLAKRVNEIENLSFKKSHNSPQPNIWPQAKKIAIYKATMNSPYR